MRTIDFKLVTTIISAICILKTEANDRSGRQLRIGRQYFNQHSENVICGLVSPHVYETMMVSKMKEMLYIASKRAVKGDCSSTDLCKSLCTSYDSFTVTNTQCQCRIESIPRTTTITSDTVTTATAPVTSVKSTPTATPTVAPIESTTKTEYCSNPYGNPCGPGSACTDTETGISCAPINVDGCPVGCGPNSSCMLQPSDRSYECVCNTGYSRPEPYLPCIANE